MKNFNMCITGNTFFFLLATEHIALFPVLKPFLKKISSSASGDKSSILKLLYGNFMSAQVYLQQNLFS
jgi:hypothetical protein